jgi:Ca2+-binding EF-hand superfamily protein
LLYRAEAAATAAEEEEEQFLEKLQTVFSSYDIDGDRFISASDLRIALAEQQPSEAQIASWIQRRDVKGSGAVSFEDFVRHYGKGK